MAQKAVGASPVTLRGDHVLVDTGILVALFNRSDSWHGAATAWLARCEANLHTVEPVLSETSFFLPPAQRAALADLAAAGTIRVHATSAAGFKRIGAILRKFASLDPDWADASLVCCAEENGIHRVATLDVRDFSAYRIHGRSKFQLEPLT
ncbi:MAG: PIN domain-containing protein [Ramlibacter sp.]|nr:PIN domain-containing protein [Ramlibacter sp.]